MIDAPDEDLPADGSGADDALPADALAALRGAWQSLPTPSPTRELSEEDEATQRAVLWLATAWRTTGADVRTAEHAPLALRVAQRRIAVQSDTQPADAPRAEAPHAAAARSVPRLTGWRRQVAAAALIVALLGAALLLRDTLAVRVAPRKADQPVAEAPAPEPAPTAPDAPDVNVAQAAPDAPVAPVAHTAPATPVAHAAPPAPVAPGAVRPLLASGSPPPVELRAGRTRLLLFTDSARPVPENQP